MSWVYSLSISDTCDFEILDSDGETIAGEYGVREESNARLIAAAPDLLEALKSLIRLQNGDLHQQTTATIEMATRAVSKAEG